METLKACPICQSADPLPFMEVPDHSVSKETFTLCRCAACGFVFTNPRPDPEEIGRYYESEDYISHSNSNKGLLNRIYKMVRNHTIRSKYRLIANEFKDRGAILDYGCGTGEFLNHMQQNAWQATGIEPDAKAREQAVGNYGLEVYKPTELQTFQTQSFSVITLWHVLEHVHDLLATMKRFNEVLQEQGLLLIAVPNRLAYESDIYKEFWAAYDVPRHLYHFSSTTMAELASRSGFEIVYSKAMFFDPFYIALLSEKYKSGKSNYLKAFYYGILTSLHGLKSEDKNSSLIYFLRKK